MKRIGKAISLILLMLVCSLAFMACGDLLKEPGGGDLSPKEVACTLGEWTEEVTIHAEGTTFNVSLAAAAPVYWKSSADESVFTYTFKNEAGEDIERTVHSQGDLPAGKYALKITPKDSSALNLKIQFYDANNSMTAADYTFGEYTPYSATTEILPAGNWYKIVLTEEKFVLLTIDSRKSESLQWLYLDCQVYMHDLKTSVLSKEMPAAVLKPSIYYIKVYSSNSKNKTNGKIKLTDARELTAITQDTVSADNIMGAMGANLYFNNTESGEFVVKFVNPKQKPRMSIYNNAGEHMATINNEELKMLNLPQGEYFVRLTATTIYQANGSVLFTKAPAQAAELTLDEPLPDKVYTAKGEWYSLTITQKTDVYVSATAAIDIFIDGEAADNETYKTLEAGTHKIWLAGSNAGISAQFVIQTVSTDKTLALDGTTTTISTDFGNSKWFELDMTKAENRNIVLTVEGDLTRVPFAVLNDEFKDITNTSSLTKNVKIDWISPSYNKSTGFNCTFTNDFTKAYFFFSSDVAKTLNISFSTLENLPELTSGAPTQTFKVTKQGYFAKVNIDGFSAVALDSTNASFIVLSNGKKFYPISGNNIENKFLKATLSGTSLIYISAQSINGSDVSVQVTDYKNANALTMGEALDVSVPNKMFFAKIEVATTGKLVLSSTHRNMDFELFDENGGKVANGGFTYKFLITTPGTYYIMLTQIEGDFTLTPTMETV